MNAWIVFQRMLELFMMILIGFFCFKKNWLDNNSYKKLSKIVVNILNPLIIINGVINQDIKSQKEELLLNIIFVFIYFILLILLSFPISRLFYKNKKNLNYLYQLMFIFSNVGFMGIPVVQSLYGESATIFISFYILAYNLLLYTYGLILVDRSTGKIDLGKEKSKQKFYFKWSSILNAGVFACLISICIILTGIHFPEGVVSFVSYMGNAAIPMSMILIGASMAAQDMRSILVDFRMYVFLLFRMVIVPISVAIIGRYLPVQRELFNIFCLIIAMPVGSIVALLAADKKANDQLCARGSVLSTLLSVITIPLTALFLV